MALYKLNEALWFPPVSYAEPDGLLAIGGDLSTERLLLAYRSGIFPWFDEESPILWWSPDPRFVLYADSMHTSTSMRALLKKGIFKVTYNQDFESVIKNCSKMERSGQDGTWITSEMEKAYIELHRLGHATSVEVWQEGVLVGGMYGVRVGKCFCGESMFSKVSNASKVGLLSFMKDHDYRLIDCQIYSDHLASLGAVMVSRVRFLEELYRI